MEIAPAVAPVDRDQRATADQAADLLADQAPLTDHQLLADPQLLAEDEVTVGVTVDRDLRDAPDSRLHPAAKASLNQKDAPDQ
jgi:hypothetical protein